MARGFEIEDTPESDRAPGCLHPRETYDLIGHSHADDLNTNAENALLKMLEEPPDRTVMILLSSSPGRLLPTIRSRCMSVALKEVPCKSLSGTKSGHSSRFVLGFFRRQHSVLRCLFSNWAVGGRVFSPQSQQNSG